MHMNVALRRFALGLAMVAALALSLSMSALPQRAVAQERPTTQAGPHPVSAGFPRSNTWQPDPMNAGLPRATNQHPSRLTNPPYWDARQLFPSLQACGADPYSLFYDPVSGFSIGAQAGPFSWRNIGVQGILSGPDLLSLYGYNGDQAAWWPDSYAYLNPMSGPCGSFQGWLP